MLIIPVQLLPLNKPQHYYYSFMEKVRDARFDTLKGFLMLSVVFGHFFSHNTTHGLVSETIANFIYSYHMPLFVFVSGYFTKNKKVVRGILRLLETYVVYQLIKGLLGSHSIMEMLVEPRPMLWYLLALIYWRLLYYGIESIDAKVSWRIIVVFILLSLGAGFLPSVGREFALSRSIFFAPFFFLGILAQKIQIIDVVKEKVGFKTGVIVLVVALVLAAVFAYTKIRVRSVFAGTSHYPLDSQWIYMLARLINYFTAVVISIAFIRVFSFENKVMGNIGKDSLKYYMFHGLFLMGVEFLHLPWSTLLAFLYGTVVTIVIYLFNKTWLSDFAVTPISFIIDKINAKKLKNNG